MNNTKKRGFTLIELLAVIVILAIIALIAVPIILNMINKARKKAAISSALGYIDSIEYYTGFRELGESGYEAEVPTGTCKKTNNAWDKTECTTFYNAVDQKSKGSKPKNANVTIENGKVKANSTFEYNGYTVVYDGVEAYIDGEASGGGSSSTPQTTFGGTVVAATTSDTHKGIVYMDPTDLENTCNQSNSVSTTGTKTGCMKFYIYDDSGDTYKMILDHNTSGNVAWNSSGNNADGMNEVATRLSEDTEGWVGSPRLITANEVAAITENDGWDSATATSSQYFFFGSNDNTTAYSSQTDDQKAKQESYHWLFDYTYDCESRGCTTKDNNKYPYGTKDSTNTAYVYGYWTQDAVVGNSSYAWSVNRIGSLNNLGVGNASYSGVRPVITIEKSKLQ